MIIAMQMLIYFRESVLAVLNGLVPPLLTRFVRKLSRSGLVPLEEDIEEQVYAEYDDECGVVFFPSVHAQRYAAVCDCLMDERWFGKLQKVLNVGKNHDINFLKYLTELPGINQILGLDIECSLNCTCDMLDLFDDYGLRRTEPLQITLLQGNAADPDYRLIGCDAVVAIEMIQQLLPHDLDRLVHNVFGFTKPWIALFTTPNADFNRFMKNLDKNGLRHSDHNFEWTRAQLHDWCGNIVERYPDYTVVSTGVGPGPDGTSHYGCYSQLVLFISKHYKKEMELDVESLVLVPNPPEPMEMTSLVWTSVVEVSSSHMLDEKTSPTDSYTTIESTLCPSAVSSVTCFRRADKSAQCNVDDELGKSFVMFHEEEYEVKMPRTRLYGDIYEIGDVASRLNNTMCEVKQFSKTTQYLLEKNEIDISDTQEIMNEISQLTVKLTSNVNRSAGDGFIWNNVNWGENVPYWNQYYKVVGVYHYPCDFQEKSEDDTILDLLLEEISKVIDMHWSEGLPRASQFEIHVAHLMHAVRHITDDVQRVVNLLEENGYEIDGELLILPAVYNSEVDDEEDLPYANIDNVYNESSYGQDFNGLLDRILCRKMKKLQIMLPSDKEIRQVLCHIICRLKKIALSSRRIQDGPERSKWLQEKLLELLTITERSILRRNLRNSQSEPFKRNLGYDTSHERATHLTQIKAQDDAVMKIVKKYENMLQMSADDADSEIMSPVKQYTYDSDITDYMESAYDADKQYKFNFDARSQSGNMIESGTSPYNDTHCLEARLQEIDELARYTFGEAQPDNIHDWKEMGIYREENYDSKKCYEFMPKRSRNKKSCKKTRSRALRFLKKYKASWFNNFCRKEETYRYGTSFVAIQNILENTSTCKFVRRNVRRTTGETNLKNYMYCNELVYVERINEVNRPSCISAAPIPNSLIELCHPQSTQKTPSRVKVNITPQTLPKDSPISATQELQIIEILTQNETLTVALQRTIGTSPDEDFEVCEHEFELSGLTTLLTESSCDIRAVPTCAHDTPEPTFQELKAPPLPIALSQNTQMVEILTQDAREIVVLQHTVGTDPILEIAPELELTNTNFKDSIIDADRVVNEPFFLYDVNEATTSKGRRHVSTDVQCGTDTTMSKYALLSATTSLTNPFNFVETEINTEDALPSGGDTPSYDILKPCVPKSSLRIKSVGIKIKDSDHKIPDSLLNQSEEKETVVEPVTITDKSHDNTDENLKNSKLVRQDKTGRLDSSDKKNKPKSGMSVDNIKRSVIATNRPKSYVIGNKTANTKASLSNDSTNIVAKRNLRQNNEMKILKRGGVHVHSYKDLQLSEDVVYQGEWQNYRQKPLKNNPPKPVDYTVYKSKYINKLNVPKKSEEAVTQRPKNAPTTIRRTKMSKLKKKTSEIDSQNKTVTLKLSNQANQANTLPIIIPKVVSKSAESRLKSIKRNSKTKIQPARQTRFQSQTIKSNEKLKRRTPDSYIPRYIKKRDEIKQIPNTRSKTRVKVKTSDSLSNLLKQNNERETSSHSKAEELISALLKVSIEPPKTISYAVYRNETVTSNFNVSVDKVTAIPRSSEKQILKRKLSSRDRDGYAGSSRRCVTTVLSSQLVTDAWPNLLNNEQEPPLKKSNIPRKSSDSKMFSRIRKLANKIMNTKKAITKPAKDSGTVKSSSKDVDLVLKPSIKKAFIVRSDSKNDSVASDNIEGSSKTQETKMDLVLDPTETESIQTEGIQGPGESASKNLLEVEKGKVPSHSSIDCRKTADAMLQIFEDSLHFLDTPLNSESESANVKNVDFENGTSTEFMTCSSPVYDGRSLNQIQSTSEFSFKSASFVSKMSDCFADIESCNVSLPRSDSKVEDICGKMETLSITRRPTAAVAFSTFSMDPELCPLLPRDRPDHVNLVDSETGSIAAGASRLTASEEVLVSGRTSQSYVSCVVDEEAEVPNWMLLNRSQQASGSAVPPPQVFELPIVAIPAPFEHGHDENGNELPVQVAAGAGDGHGVHSDLSQDSSGRGTSSSSSVDSSRAHSEDSSGRGTSFSSSVDSSSSSSELRRDENGIELIIEDYIVVDPETFAAQYDAQHAQAHSSNVVYSRPVSIDTSFISAIDIPSLRGPNRHSTRREDLPASDADVSSIDTDVASD